MCGITTYQKAPNSTFSTTVVLEYMVDSIIQGYSRFSHMDELRRDNAYVKIKGTNPPSEKVCRDLLKVLPDKAPEELRILNKKLLAMQAANEASREVTLNFDDTVCTVFGHQEGARTGYNPRYKGRPSFKEKIGIIADTDELLNLTLEDGRHHTNHEFLKFFKSCEQVIPDTWYIKRIRGARGIFDQKNLKYFEDQCYEYVIKAKLQSGVKRIIDYVNQHPDLYSWVPVNKIFSVTEITIALPSWDKARRFIIIRKSLLHDYNGQITFDIDEFKYEYQAIVTSIDYLTPVEIFHDYNQRCDIENKIDELKEGFAFDQNSQRNQKCNELFLLIKMIAYNLHNWFKRNILPAEIRHHEITTIRRILYKIAGNIVGNGRYRHIRFAPNPRLKRVIAHIRDALEAFRLQKTALFTMPRNYAI